MINIPILSGLLSSVILTFKYVLLGEDCSNLQKGAISVMQEIPWYIIGVLYYFCLLYLQEFKQYGASGIMRSSIQVLIKVLVLMGTVISMCLLANMIILNSLCIYCLISWLSSISLFVMFFLLKVEEPSYRK